MEHTNNTHWFTKKVLVCCTSLTHFLNKWTSESTHVEPAPTTWAAMPIASHIRCPNFSSFPLIQARLCTAGQVSGICASLLGHSQLFSQKLNLFGCALCLAGTPILQRVVGKHAFRTVLNRSDPFSPSYRSPEKCANATIALTTPALPKPWIPLEWIVWPLRSCSTASLGSASGPHDKRKQKYTPGKYVFIISTWEKVTKMFSVVFGSGK